MIALFLLLRQLVDIVTPVLTSGLSILWTFGVMGLFGIPLNVVTSTVPILFQPEEPGAIERAHACYAGLMDEGYRLGLVPYRVGTTAMWQTVERSGDSHWNLIRQLKSAVDPKHLIAPGRYSQPER